VPPAHVFPPTWGAPVSSTLPCFGAVTSNPLGRSTVICKYLCSATNQSTLPDIK
jgi:hypothetical protein